MQGDIIQNLFIGRLAFAQVQSMRAQPQNLKSEAFRKEKKINTRKFCWKSHKILWCWCKNTSSRVYAFECEKLTIRIMFQYLLEIFVNFYEILR